MPAQTDFFKQLYEHSEGTVEIRVLPSGRQQYFPLSELDQLARYCQQNSGQDIYFGVATRDGQGGGKKNIVSIPAIWADCDFKDIDRKRLYEHLKQFPFTPSMIVKSGGGVHFYWQLDEPASQKDIGKVEDCNRRIAARMGGDMNATDAARILRVPDTKNHKYKPARAVLVSQVNSFYYMLDDFLDLLPQVSTPASKPDVDGKPDAWLLEALKGVKAHSPGRDTTGAKIAGYFIDKLPGRDVLTILLAWNERNQPPLPKKDIIRIVKSISKYRQPENQKFRAVSDKGEPKHEFKRIDISNRRFKESI
jgi:hypothetical protein